MNGAVPNQKRIYYPNAFQVNCTKTWPAVLFLLFQQYLHMWGLFVFQDFNFQESYLQRLFDLQDQKPYEIFLWATMHSVPMVLLNALWLIICHFLGLEKARHAIVILHIWHPANQRLITLNPKPTVSVKSSFSFTRSTFCLCRLLIFICRYTQLLFSCNNQHSALLVFF